MPSLRFPNLETLRLALTSRTIPDAVSLAPAHTGFESDGAVWVRPSVKMTSGALAELRRLGVRDSKWSTVQTDEPVTCWPQVLPVARDGPPTLTDKTPVLFELDEEQVSDLVGEILRLGNGRQGFRWLTVGTRARALVRVIGPPYYSLLRALDRTDGQATRAYIERAPRVWVEVGHGHPLADRLQPPAGKLLLLRPPREWLALDEAPFRDVYEALEFRLPAPLSSWTPADLSRRVEVPLRLARGGSTEPAELWVLRDRADEQVEALVRNADDRLLDRLAFAVGTAEGRTSIVLRARPSKQAVPVLVLDAVGYRPYLKLPNLFLPCGTRLHPPLRRDAVARLLASDPDRITWLQPEAEGEFRPESLPDDAFRPLAQWVDYVLDRDHEALQAWVQAARFDFEPFICREDQPEPADQPPKRETLRTKVARRLKQEPSDPEPAPDPQVDFEEVARQKTKRDQLVQVQVLKQPDELQRELFALEDRFLALDSPLDAPERRDLWRAMAALNTRLNRAGDTTVCWANAVWEEPALSSDDLQTWAAAEEVRARHAPTSGASLDRLLVDANPDGPDLRALATYLAWAASSKKPAAELSTRLPKIQHFLERHEGLLPVRLAWLAWSAVVALSGGDVLALARARDRVLERLFQNGLSAELDLPGFLRFSGGVAGERVRKVRDHLLRMQGLARAWVVEGMMVAPGTKPLADLMFAFGLARVGDANECHHLVREAEAELARGDQVSRWLKDAYGSRIRDALDGRGNVGSLPKDLLDALEQMDRDPRYKVDRLRRNSRILEPHERIEPYRRWAMRFHNELDRELAILFDVRDNAELSKRLSRLLRPKAPEPNVLATALELGPRLGEEFSRGVLDQVLPVSDAQDDIAKQATLLEKGLYLAAHFDRPDQVQAFVARLHRLLQEASAEQAASALEPLLGQTFRGLRKLGMRDEISALLARMAALVLVGKEGEETDPLAFRAERTGPKAPAWSETLRLLLHVAAGWFYFGQDDRARHILDETRAVLLEGDLGHQYQTRLACSYIAALGQAPIELALPRIEELFHRLERVHDPYTTNSHYSLSRLDVIEAVVLALISDDLMYDKTGRRWLDDDEFLVRRRIHRDVRQAIGQGA